MIGRIAREVLRAYAACKAHAAPPQPFCHASPTWESTYVRPRCQDYHVFHEILTWWSFRFADMEQIAGPATSCKTWMLVLINRERRARWDDEMMVSSAGEGLSDLCLLHMQQKWYVTASNELTPQTWPWILWPLGSGEHWCCSALFEASSLRPLKEQWLYYLKSET